MVLLAMPGMAPSWPGLMRFGLILLVHGAVLLMVSALPAPTSRAAEPPLHMAIRLSVPAQALPARRQPPVVTQRAAAPAAAALPAQRTAPVVAAPAAVMAAAAVAVATHPAAPAASPAIAAAPAAAPAAPEPASDARFDADYLHNPAPAYPAAARRAGEQGRVLLSVRVNARGEADSVQLRSSSGFSRLDEAAMSVVRQWRFVPATRGGQAVADTVLVPLNFSLG